MKSNDDYLKEVNKRIKEEGDLGFRRSASRGSNRQLLDPSREVTPYTRINLATSSKNVEAAASQKRSQLDVNQIASVISSGDEGGEGAG